jgi:TIR domain.
MTNTKRPLRVFLCHASGDKPAVIKLYDRLVKDGIDAWLDKEKLIPGQDWQIEIPKAVKNSDVVIVCLSSQSITKEGFVQKEIKIALDAADEKPDGTIFIIPAKLENCEVPERITRFHWVDLFSNDGYEWLMKALKIRANNLGITVKRKKKLSDAPVKVSPDVIEISQNPSQSGNDTLQHNPTPITDISKNQHSKPLPVEDEKVLAQATAQLSGGIIESAGNLYLTNKRLFLKPNQFYSLGLGKHWEVPLSRIVKVEKLNHFQGGTYVGGAGKKLVVHLNDSSIHTFSFSLLGDIDTFFNVLLTQIVPPLNGK